jgi:pimeloyl-ACP methyl ester carboxylesterase
MYGKVQNSMTSSIPVTSGIVAVTGVHLYYEVRGSGPLMVLVGSPMHAEPFASVAELLASDHTVLTADPRGHFNSVLDDPESDSTPELRAADLAQLISHVDAGPATVFGSSGGALTALALVQTRPDLVRRAIVHEPPLVELLDERAGKRAVIDDTVATYRSGDNIGAIRKFFAFGEVPMSEEMLGWMFGGGRTVDAVASERYFYLHELRGSAGWVPNLGALGSAHACVVVGVGEASTGQLCDRTSRALAAALNVEIVLFPSGHIGFIEDPVGFADRIRMVASCGPG